MSKKSAKKKKQRVKEKTNPNITLNLTESAQTHNAQGIALAQLGNFVEATVYFQRAIASNPNDAQIHNNLGIALTEQGQFDQAVDSYHHAIVLNPNYAEAYYNLGNTLRKQNKLEQTIEAYQSAIALNPNYAEMHLNLGNVLHEQEKFDEAIDCYHKALSLNPNYAEAHYNLGIILNEPDKLDEAIDCYQQALALNPNYAEAHYKLGMAFRKQDKLDKAMECFQKAISLNPYYAEAHYNLGMVFKEQEQLDKAIACYQRALTSNLNDANVYFYLGIAYSEQDKFAEAVDCFQQVLILKPNNTDATLYLRLGNALKSQGKLTQALANFQHAITLQPDLIEAHYSLGMTLSDQGMIDEGINQIKKSLEITPTNVVIHQALVMMLNYTHSVESTDIFVEHQRFNEQHAMPLAASIQPHLNDRNLQRQLKVGYVSPDFRGHSVAFFIESVLAHHNQQQFEVFCYYNNTHIDNVTQRLQQYTQHWITCFGLSDDELVDKIRQDQIDILVDLAGHTDKNRLMVFARKPAPVQITYLGYVTTTGLTTIDYRITDGYVDTKDIEESLNSETLIRMPDSYFCYTPPEISPSVNELPLLQQGYITFGSFNNYYKLSLQIKTLWADVLKAVSGSKLLLKTKSLNDPATRQALEEQFFHLGVEPERLILTSFVSSTEEHLRTYHQIDIGFDSSPYNGATTTCEALWMGIPVVTLVGKRHVSRMGFSILSTLGLTELIAHTPEEYVEICIKLANDTKYLQKLRSEMRERMLASPLMDGVTFTRHLETAYQAMWEKWCKGL